MTDSQNPSARWRTDAGKTLAAKVVARLVAGKPLNDLGLGTHEGRLDLRGLPFPQPQTVGRPFESHGLIFSKVRDRVCIRGRRLTQLDLSGAVLDFVLLQDTKVDDCRFANARFPDLGMVRTEVSDCSFARADFREASLGAWVDGGNVFRRVSFVGADLRVGECSAATFTDCDFSHARLDKVEFESSSFIRCRFAGELRGVIFNNHGFKTGKPDPNPMEDVDFSGAVFRDVEFRGLNLDRVIFPKGPDHLIVRHYRCVLERAVAELAGDKSVEARQLRAVFEHDLKWAGPEQDVGVFGMLDYDSKQLAERAVALLRRCESVCAEQGRPVNRPFSP